MKSSLGLAGKAFTNGTVSVDEHGNSLLISEEKDLTKLRVQSINKAVSIPILDKQTTNSIAVMTIYNYADPLPDNETLQSIGSMLSSVLFAVELHQGFLIQ